MPKVKNLTISLQSGTTNTHYATWAFQGDTKTTTTVTSSGGVKQGALVTIKSGAKWYNGASIPSYVMNQRWYVYQLKGSRAVLHKNESGGGNIMSPIHVNNLTAVGGGGSSSSTTTTTTSVSTCKEYSVKWYYETGNGVWFSGTTGTVSTDEPLNHSYSPPDNAVKIKCWVKPIAKTYTKDNKEVEYWTGTAVTKEYYISSNPPSRPSTPNVSLDDNNKRQLNISITGIEDAKCEKIQFEIYNGTSKIHSATVTVTTAQALYSYVVPTGGSYRVRCRAINIVGSSNVYSEWSLYSSAISGVPAAPAEITEIKATSETSVYLAWGTVQSADTYDVEYTTELRYFEGSNSVSGQSGIETTNYEFTGMETGDEYFFRVRAVNESGPSDWSPIKSVILGDKPSAPTTWSSTTTVIVGETLKLYWVHNSADGSSQTYAELNLYINGTKHFQTIQNSTDEDLKDKTSVFEIDTSQPFEGESFIEGVTIEWEVRTAGVTLQYGDWSVKRKIEVYAQPTLGLSVTDAESNVLSVIDSFPFYIKGMPGPNTQAPIGYHISITPNETYEDVDSLGNPKIINAGDVIYSKYFDITDSLTLMLSADSVNLANNISYTVTGVVSMNSGLTTTAATDFLVEWSEDSYEPDLGITIDDVDYSAYLVPYCRDEEGVVIDGVTLSVYRKEYDGRFTEIATNIPNNETVVMDPHPALDYARYRVVATTESTGTIGFYDPPPYPVGGNAVIIQWDETWTSFNTDEEAELEDPPWSGSMLQLPYNIDISEGNRVDVELVEYIGRSHPVSYYGTQLGETATWNMDIDKKDAETVYGLRRLAKYMGDVYVREPGGSGYWANVSVSFSKTYNQLTIPVSLSLTRVEGGM